MTSLLDEAVPGQVVHIDGKRHIFVAKINRDGGPTGYLFNTGLVLTDIDDRHLSVCGGCESFFLVYGDALVKIISHGLPLENVTELRTGQVVISIGPSRIATIQKIAVLDRPQGMAFDQNGGAVDFWNKVILKTNVTVPTEDLLTETGRRELNRLYPD